MSAKRFQELGQETNSCILEGFHAVKHAIRFGAEINYAVCVNKTEVLKLASELAPDVTIKLRQLLLEEWEQSEWEKLGYQISTGIVAVASKRPYQLNEVLDKDRPIVLLEEPRNLGNVGAVIRVAAAADAGGVIMSGTIDPWAPAVIRGAAGLQYAVPVVSTTKLKYSNRPIYALDPDGDNLEITYIPNNAILAFGTERGGLSQELLKKADYRVAIPMRDKVSSMNLATSVAVALYAYKFSRRS